MAGKVAERSWDAASTWLSAKFGNHAEAVRDQAMLNSAEFLGQLAERVRRLENQHMLDLTRIGGHFTLWGRRSPNAEESPRLSGGLS